MFIAQFRGAITALLPSFKFAVFAIGSCGTLDVNIGCVNLLESAAGTNGAMSLSVAPGLCGDIYTPDNAQER